MDDIKQKTRRVRCMPSGESKCFLIAKFANFNDSSENFEFYFILMTFAAFERAFRIV